MLLKYLVDSHVHTICSHDGKSDMPSYLNVAKEKNVGEITFTDHYDIYDGVETELKTMDVANYRKKYEAFAQNIKELDIATHFGIEIGLRPEAEQKIKDMTSANRFDFIIGSSHITCGKDIAKDPSFFEGLSRYEAYLKYFNEVENNIYIFDDFDVYGHLDYVVRYGGYEGDDAKIIRREEFGKNIDRILTALIKKDKGIEVNSSGIRYQLGLPHPNMDIVARYVELGGKIITVGSDAHCAKDLAKYIQIVLDLLRRRNVKEIAVFKNRTPYFYRI